MITEKQNVTYRPNFDDFIAVDSCAYVHALNHPKLGEMDVRTSKVISYDKQTGVFETLNSIYTPEVV